MARPSIRQVVTAILDPVTRPRFNHGVGGNLVSAPPPRLIEGPTPDQWRALTNERRIAILDHVAPLGADADSLVRFASFDPLHFPRGASVTPPPPPVHAAPTARTGTAVPSSTSSRPATVRTVVLCSGDCGRFVPAKGHRPRASRCPSCRPGHPPRRRRTTPLAADHPRPSKHLPAHNSAGLDGFV